MRNPTVHSDEGGKFVEDQFLSKGQNIELPPDELDQIDIVITWDNTEFGVDASALLLGADGKVRSDADFVFYNQQESADGSVRYLGRREAESGPHERLLVHLAAVPDQVDAIALIGSVDTGSFGDLGKLALQLVDSGGSPIAEYVTADASTETAFVFGQVYRRSGKWKLRAIGQGWASGLAGLAEDFGVDVSEDAPVEEPGSPELEAIQPISEQEPSVTEPSRPRSPSDSVVFVQRSRCPRKPPHYPNSSTQSPRPGNLHDSSR